MEGGRKGGMREREREMRDAIEMRAASLERARATREPRRLCQGVSPPPPRVALTMTASPASPSMAPFLPVRDCVVVGWGWGWPRVSVRAGGAMRVAVATTTQRADPTAQFKEVFRYAALHAPTTDPGLGQGHATGGRP